MLAKLWLTLSSEGEDIACKQVSLLQDVLMKQTSEAYAAKLKTLSVPPYSQYLSQNHDDTASWRISALNMEAYRQMILPLLSTRFSSFQLNGKSIRILNRKLTTTSEEELLRSRSTSETGACFDLSFLTPTAFQQESKYTLLPEPLILYQSILKRIEAVSDLKISDAEQLCMALSQNTIVKRFCLHTQTFAYQNDGIPGFTGTITMKICGGIDEVSMASYLIRFGEYSGIGQKTDSGMGGMRIAADEKNNRRKKH